MTLRGVTRVTRHNAR